MAKLKTYRAWFRDDTMMMVTAENDAAAKATAEAKSRDNLRGAYFESDRERRKASTVKTIECLD